MDLLLINIPQARMNEKIIINYKKNPNSDVEYSENIHLGMLHGKKAILGDIFTYQGQSTVNPLRYVHFNEPILLLDKNGNPNPFLLYNAYALLDSDLFINLIKEQQTLERHAESVRQTQKEIENLEENISPEQNISCVIAGKKTRRRRRRRRRTYRRRRRKSKK